jgi:hypothetical protein
MLSVNDYVVTVPVDHTPCANSAAREEKPEELRVAAINC